MTLRMNLVKRIAFFLNKTQGQLATAESCTGGLIAASLTELPGSSAWFDRGFVTYSNQSKQDLLSVPAEVLTQYGAVSEETAYHMVLGALKHSNATLAVAVTGVAGPDGGSLDKPVGTVCFAWGLRGAVPVTLRKQLGGSRKVVREKACLQALEGILSFEDRVC